MKSRTLIQKLYDAAEELSDSCHDSFDPDNGMYYSEKAKEKLDKILKEIKGEIQP